MSEMVLIVWYSRFQVYAKRKNSEDEEMEKMSPDVKSSSKVVDV